MFAQQLLSVALLLGVAVVQGDWWKPPQIVSWDYQLSDPGSITLVPGVELYVIDMETAKKEIPRLQKAVPGVRVVCYFSSGSWEKARQKYDTHRGQFKIRKGEWKGIRGKPLADWPGERWLDIRSPKVRSIMERRLRYAKSISCDGVEVDNNDGYAQDSGFPLKEQDQIDYSQWIANMAHSLGLGIGLKNVPTLVPKLKDYFDWFVIESCFTFNECGIYSTVGDKAVLGVQYCDAAEVFGEGYVTSDPSCFCPKANDKGWNFLVKRVEAGSGGISCRDYCQELGACKARAGSCPAEEDNICDATFG